MVSYINIVHAIIPIVIAIVCLRIIFVHYYQLPPSSNFKNNINYSIEKNISLSQQFFRQGLLAYQNRRYQVAHQLLLNATKTDPFYADAYYNLAIVEETIFHNFESALKHYEQTILYTHDVEVRIKALWNKAVCYENDLNAPYKALDVWRSLREQGIDKNSPLYNDILMELKRIEKKLNIVNDNNNNNNNNNVKTTTESSNNPSTICKKIDDFLQFIETYNPSVAAKKGNRKHKMLLHKIMNYLANANNEYFISKTQFFILELIIPEWHIVFNDSSPLFSTCNNILNSPPINNNEDRKYVDLSKRISFFQDFIYKVSSSIVQLQNTNMKHTFNDENLNILIIGGSVAGLTTAIESIKMGASKVVLMEKRNVYKRKFWWDLNIATINKLNAWGYPYNVNYVEEVEGIHTIQCYMLENFLSLLAFIISAATAAEKPSTLIIDYKEFDPIKNDADKKYLNKFQIIYGCDGTKSIVRKYLNINYNQSNVFQPLHSNNNNLLATLPNNDKNLEQATIILAYKLERNNKCPSLRLDPKTGIVYSPFITSFYFQGITSVFKRFNEPFCEMQILFSNEFSKIHFFHNEVDGELDEDFFPYKILVNLTNFLIKFDDDLLLKNKYDLRKKIMNIHDNEGSDINAKKHILYHTMSTRTAEIPSKLITINDNNNNNNNNERKKQQLFILRGDALISAYYRLGIGINAIFQTLDTQVTRLIWEYKISQHLDFLNQHNFLEYVNNRLKIRMKKDVEFMQHVQLNTMFYELYCNKLLVDATNLNHLVLMRKNYKDETFVELFIDDTIKQWNNDDLESFIEWCNGNEEEEERRG